MVSAASSPDGTRLITVSKDNAVEVWDAAPGQPLASLLEEPTELLSAAVQSRRHPRRHRELRQDRARIWDSSTRKPITSPLEHRDVASSAAFSPDGIRVVTTSADGTARIWDTATGKLLLGPLESSPFHTTNATNAILRWGSIAAFIRDGTRVVTASQDKTVRIWDVGIDDGTLEQWSAVVERSPFVLSDSVLVRPSPVRPQPEPEH